MKAKTRNKAHYVDNMFTTIAPRYDLLNTMLSFNQDRRWRRFTANQCHGAPDGMVLDVCTGTGELARTLVQQNDKTVVGIDFNADMLANANVKLDKWAEGKDIRLIRGDAMRLPFATNTFSCATIGFALRNVADVAVTFREMARVVKPGGKVISLELTRPPSAWVRPFYYLYLRRIAPIVGGIISGKREAYVYLPDSILEFPPPEKVAEIMRQTGLCEVKTYRLTFGSATVQVGTK